MVSGTLVNVKAMELSILETATSMKENGLTIKDTDMVYLLSKIGESTKVNGKTTRCTAKEFSTMLKMGREYNKKASFRTALKFKVFIRMWIK